MEGYLIDLATLEEFYKRCEERKAISRDDRTKILEELQHELRAIKVNDEDIKRQIKGKKVLHIKKGK